MKKAASPNPNAPGYSALAFLVAGAWGMLALFAGIAEFSAWVFPGTAGLCWALWLALRRKKGLAYGLSALTTALCGLTAAAFPQALGEQWRGIAEAASGGPKGPPATGVVLLLSALFVCCAFALEFFFPAHWLLCGAVDLLLLAGPLAGISGNIPAAVLLAAFQLGFWGLNRKGSGGAGRNRALCGILAVVLLISGTAAPAFSSYLFNGVYALEGFAYRRFGQPGPAASGRLNRGNNYYTGEARLELIVSDRPGEPFYLPGFLGGVYGENGWEAADDELLFAEMTQAMAWNSWPQWASSLFRSLYYVINNNTNLAAERRFLTIRPLASDRAVYRPYYSQENWLDVTTGKPLSGEWGEKSYRYFERGDIALDWENISSDFRQPGQWYHDVQTSYLQVVQPAYTQVSAGLLPRLVRLTEENPQGTLREITAFILNTLHDSAVYTRTPGWTPLNREPVEDFLFSRKKGYCQHFAAAAVLMYRLYGVPARYAAGYLAQPEDFSPQEDGTYRAVLTDEAAHAWAEIFLEDYGWVPIETTPGAEGASGTVYPGFDRPALEQMRQAGSWDISGLGAVRRGQSGGEDGGYWPDFFSGLAPWAEALLACAALFLPLWLDFRRFWRLGKLRGKGCRRIWDQMLDALHFGGYLPGYTGTEEGFPARLAAEIPEISLAEASRLVGILSMAAYGPEGPGPREEEWVWAFYLRVSRAVFDRLSWWRKAVFCYIKNYR